MNPFIIVILAIILIIFFVVIGIYNKLNKCVVKIDESFSGIDVALTKRYDVLTKMVEVVKGYTKYEKETLMEVISLRNGMSMKEKVDADKSMNKSFEKVNLLVEKYPDLKASENFKILEKSVVDVEEHLQAARRLYNSSVSRYNELLVTFPSNIIANMFKFTKRDFFEAEENTKSYNVEM